MGTPSEWPSPYKRIVLATATLLVLLSYFVMCIGLMKISTLLLH